MKSWHLSVTRSLTIFFTKHHPYHRYLLLSLCLRRSYYVHFYNISVGSKYPTLIRSWYITHSVVHKIIKLILFPEILCITMRKILKDIIIRNGLFLFGNWNENEYVAKCYMNQCWCILGWRTFVYCL